MSNTRKILLGIFAALTVFALLVIALYFALHALLLYLFPVKGHHTGELIATTVSPGGRWKTKIYYIDPGAMASATYYTRTTDLKDRMPRRDVPFGGDQMRNERITWKNPEIVDVYGVEVNVKTSTVKREKSISPNGRWRVQFYYYPVTNGRRSWDGRNVKDFDYMVVTDLRREEAPRKIYIDQKKINRGTIVWKSDNVIDAYGDVIDLRKSAN